MPPKKYQTYAKVPLVSETRHCKVKKSVKKSETEVTADDEKLGIVNHACIMEEEKIYKQENPPIAHVDWKLPARGDMDFHKWNIGQMAEWVFSVTGSEKSRAIIRAHEMDGSSMSVFLENEETRDDLKFGFWPWRKLQVAAKKLIEYHNSNAV